MADLFNGGLTLVHSLSVAGTLSGFGAILFGVLVASRSIGTEHDEMRSWGQLASLVRFSALASGLATLAWIALETAELAGTTTLGDTLSALGDVATGTLFGRLAIGQLIAQLAILLLLGRGTVVRWRVAAAVSGAATLMLAGHSHAFAESGVSVALLPTVVHLLSAGAWLGGLLPLLIVVRAGSPRTGVKAARWFSPLGKVCVAGMAASSVGQFASLVGDIPGLFGTTYGLIVLAKIGLLGALTGLAVLNRYRFAPDLVRGEPLAARSRLTWSIAVQTVVGLLAVVAAAALSNLSPASHEQPVWPFPYQVSLTALEDADLRREATIGMLLVAGAAFAAAGLAWRRTRWPSLAISVVFAWLASSHLDPLFVPAYPTSFYRSPTSFDTASIVAGAELYGVHCSSCHGADGRGTGPAASTLPVPPADLTAAHLWDHDDGELYWWLAHGIDDPSGGPQHMPGFATVLPGGAIWSLIDYVRARNAGTSLGDRVQWPRPIPAPPISASCAGGRRLDDAQLDGRVLRLIVAGREPDAAIAPSDPKLVQDVLVPSSGVRPATGCVADDENLLPALSILTGQPSDELPGTEILIDQEHNLRARSRPGQSAGWQTTAGLRAEVEEICRPQKVEVGRHVHGP